jgi:hypothetical protein
MFLHGISSMLLYRRRFSIAGNIFLSGDVNIATFDFSHWLSNGLPTGLAYVLFKEQNRLLGAYLSPWSPPYLRDN